MVDTSRGRVSATAQSQIDDKVEFEREKAIREGQSGQQLRETVARVRNELEQGERLQDITRRRAGKDDLSPRQRAARAARDQRRREGTPQLSREQLAQRGRLAGSRGQEGVTRTPSRIRGNLSAAGSRGGFGVPSARASFGGRRAVLQQTANEQVRRSRERSTVQTRTIGFRPLQPIQTPGRVEPLPFSRERIRPRGGPGPEAVTTAIDRGAAGLGPREPFQERRRTSILRSPLRGSIEALQRESSRQQQQVQRRETFGSLFLASQVAPRLSATAGGLGFIESIVTERGRRGFVQTGRRAREVGPRSFILEEVGPQIGQISRQEPASFVGEARLVTTGARVPIPRTVPTGLRIRTPRVVGTSVTSRTVGAGRASGRVTRATATAQLGDIRRTSEAVGVESGLNLPGGVTRTLGAIETRTPRPGREPITRTITTGGRFVQLEPGLGVGTVASRRRRRILPDVRELDSIGTQTVGEIDGLTRRAVVGRTFRRRAGGLVRPRELPRTVGFTREDVAGRSGPFRFSSTSSEFVTADRRVFDMFRRRSFRSGDLPQAFEQPRTRPTSRDFTNQRRIIAEEFSIDPPRPIEVTRQPGRPTSITINRAEFRRPQQTRPSSFEVTTTRAATREALGSFGLRERVSIRTRRVRSSRPLPRTRFPTTFGVTQIPSQVQRPINIPLLDQRQQQRPDTTPFQPIRQVPRLGDPVTPTTTTTTTPILDLGLRGGSAISVGSFLTPPPILRRGGGSFRPRVGGGPINLLGRGGRGLRQFGRRRRAFTPTVFGGVLAETGTVLRQQRARGLPGFLIRGEGPGFRFPTNLVGSRRNPTRSRRRRTRTSTSRARRKRTRRRR